MPALEVLSPIDLAIVGLYFALVMAMGFLVRKRATKDTDAYYLAGRGIPWWMLGLSGCSSYIDIGGTMGMIGLLFYLGFQGVWVTHVFWGWLIIAGYMAFQAKWIRRSGVMTFAEWNVTRFGGGRATEGARITAAAFLLVLMLANLTYIAVGIGKFAPVYLPWNRVTCTLLILGVVGVYVTLGGFFGVIFTDIAQTVLIVVGAVILAGMAMKHAGPETWTTARPDWWWSLDPKWSLPLKDVIPKFTPKTAYYAQFEHLGPLLIGGAVWLVARVLAGPNVWDFQFFLSAKSPRDAALAGGVWTVGYTFRWLMAASLLAFGLAWFGKEGAFDSELIMPRVIAELPSGLRGILLAILLAAFMSTFDAMINVTSSVAVNDFIGRYLARGMSQKGLVRLGQVFSLVALGAAAFLSLTFRNVNQIWEAMIFSVVTAILVPSMLRWHWGRFNAQGFTWGVILTGAACLADVILRAAIPSYPPQWQTLPFLVVLSLVFSVGAALLTEPTPMEARAAFYGSVRPFGFWKKERKEARRLGLVPEGDRTPFWDAASGILSAAFQIALCLVPFHLVLGNKKGAWLSLAAVLALAGALYFTWYRRLPPREA